MKRGKIPVEDAVMIADDLPDGAFFALVEELSGCDAGAVLEQAEPVEPKRKRRRRRKSKHARSA